VRADAEKIARISAESTIESSLPDALSAAISSSINVRRSIGRSDYIQSLIQSIKLADMLRALRSNEFVVSDDRSLLTIENKLHRLAREPESARATQI
jgi:hypothetical protein